MTPNDKPTERRFSKLTFLGLSWILVGCIAAQTFLAGLAVFSDPAHWSKHVSFVHFMEFVPLLMLLFAFIGKLPVQARWLSAALFALIFSQYATAHAPGAGALHPVIALVLFWVSVVTARRASGWKR